VHSENLLELGLKANKKEKEPDLTDKGVRNLLILFVMLFSFFCHMQGRSTGNMFLLLDEKDHTRSKKKHDDERR